MRFEPEQSESSESRDEELVHLILSQGSERAFRVLYARHAPRMYRVAWRMLGSETDAEDVLQESWLRACARLQGFEWRSLLGTWLTSIVVNVSRDLLEKRGRWMDVQLEENLVFAEAVDAPESVDLERAIAALPSGCRAAFILHDIEGYTHQEIAKQLGYTVGTSKSQVFRARRSLRRALGQADMEETKNVQE
jgi:RNA polymerase sigma-70 factor (ECF subfamily)